MNEKIKKLMNLIEADGLGNEFEFFGGYTVAAEEWPNDYGCGSYYQYYLLYGDDIEITTTDRDRFVSYLQRLV